MEPLFVAFTSQASQRAAVIAEEVDSIWLYLSRPNERAPERDCWLLNTDAEPRRDREYYRQQKSAQPARPWFTNGKLARGSPRPCSGCESNGSNANARRQVPGNRHDY